MKAAACAILCLSLAVRPCEAGGSADRVTLYPKLQAGQTFTYQIHYHAEKKMKTESAVASPMATDRDQMDVSRALRVEVMDVRGEGDRSAFVLRVRLAETSAAPQDMANGKTVELTLHGDGRVSDEKGVDTLSIEEHEGWRDWVTQFGTAAAFPRKGVRPGEKWKTVEPIPGAALASLVWEKQSEYVRNEVCPVDSKGPTPEANSKLKALQETCAVILTRATLKQKSSPKDATPEEYRLHELRTTGTARGANEVISYISLKTGLVVRATEEANQAMGVTVAKADGTNRVHYSVDAKSHSEVLLVVDPR